MVTWFSALVALESNSPSQERAWLFKKEKKKRAESPTARQPEKQSRSEVVAGAKPREPCLRGYSTVVQSVSHD